MKVALQRYVGILLLREGDTGVVTLSRFDKFKDQPAFKKDGKIVVFDQDEGRFIRVRETTLGAATMVVKIEEKQIINLPGV